MKISPQNFNLRFIYTMDPKGATRQTCEREALNLNIASFPSELLSEVFQYLLWTSPLEADLVSATHVCARWRAAALNNPLLWANVTVSNVSKAQTFIERSKESFLHIDVPCTFTAVETVTQCLQHNRMRLRSARIDTVDSIVAFRYMDYIGQNHFPKLRVLHVIVSEQNDTDPITSVVAYNLSGAFARQNWDNDARPALHSLHLHHVDMVFSWAWSLCRNLSVLDIRTPETVMFLKELLRALLRCPTLKTLNLACASFDKTSVLDSEWLVKLPRLEALHLEGPAPADIANLLGRLSTPSTTRFFLKSDYLHSSGSQYSALPVDCTRLPSLLSLQTVSFTQRNDEITVVASPHTSDPPSATPTFTFSLRAPDLAPALETLCGVVSVSAPAIETLSVTFTPGWSDALPLPSWHAMLSRLPRLRTLRLADASNNSLRGALHALRAPPSAPELPAGIPCPTLAALVLERAQRPGRVSTDVLWTARERKRRGCAIGCVSAGEGVLSARCVELLRELGVEVVLSAPSENSEVGFLRNLGVHTLGVSACDRLVHA